MICIHMFSHENSFQDIDGQCRVRYLSTKLSGDPLGSRSCENVVNRVQSQPYQVQTHEEVGVMDANMAGLTSEAGF
jgi:hypothetical protein